METLWHIIPKDYANTNRRDVLSQGLVQHRKMSMGTLPGRLEEEILARSHPPIPWDVELSNWLDRYIKQPERLRTYSRLSRRQSATPNIPLPGRIHPEEETNSRTFGVLLDTSGSMSRKILGTALGAIASYAESRSVSQIRLIYCDVQTYDEGYVTPEQLSVQFKVKGRGGTRLQPALNHIHLLHDFPPSAPILIITDGLCDPIATPRKHAFLMPRGARLPFFPIGEVFWMERN
jgi:predicted metal-dependent peptidase